MWQQGRILGSVNSSRHTEHLWSVGELAACVSAIDVFELSTDTSCSAMKSCGALGRIVYAQPPAQAPFSECACAILWQYYWRSDIFSFQTRQGSLTHANSRMSVPRREAGDGELLNNQSTLKDVKKQLLKKDWECCVVQASQHASTAVAAQVASSVSWVKLWDMALDYGPHGTKSLQALYRTLTRPSF